ncbi:MAG: DUF192 domain-containing protein [Paracoccaceae bacterium]
MGNRYRRSRRLIAASVTGAVILFSATQAFATCREDQVHVRGDWGQARFSVEVADDEAERAQGLMHRESLASSAGMLFLYDRPQNLSFWMRNTLIELDLIFIDSHGVITHVHDRAQPLDETPIPGGLGRAVLEINGGLARRMGISVGSQIKHPAFGAGAAWACVAG